MSHVPRATRHSGHRPQKMLAIIIAVVVLGGVGGFLFDKFGPPAHQRPLSTTPECLSRNHAFCTGVALAQVNYKTIASFAHASGVHPQLVEYYQRFGRPFSADVAAQVARARSRPFIQLNPHNVSLAKIASGRYDAYLKTFAAAARDFELPLVICFGHEMNGTWSSWSKPDNPPASFVAAWRHIHDVFTKTGAYNVTWAWDISHGARPPQQWWPGAKYVDWIGIDGYLRSGQTFAGQFSKAIRAVRGFAPGKPIIIAETGVQPGPSAVRELHELFGRAQAWDLRGLIWFNQNKKENWKLVPHTPLMAAFTQQATSASSPAKETK